MYGCDGAESSSRFAHHGTGPDHFERRSWVVHVSRQVQTLEEGVVLVEGNHRSFQAGFVVIDDLRVYGARLAGQRTERRLAHAVAESHHEEVLVGVRALPRRDRGRWILIRPGPLSVRDQNISRVTSRLVVLRLGVVNELERPFEPIRHVGTAIGVELINESAQSGLEVRHRAGQRGETRVGRGNGTELHDAVPNPRTSSRRAQCSPPSSAC